MAVLIKYPIIITDAYQFVVKDKEPYLINCLLEDVGNVEELLRNSKLSYTVNKTAFKIMDERSLLEIAFPVADINTVINPKAVFIVPFLPDFLETKSYN